MNISIFFSNVTKMWTLDVFPDVTPGSEVLYMHRTAQLEPFTSEEREAIIAVATEQLNNNPHRNH